MHDGFDVVPAGFRRRVKMGDPGHDGCGWPASGGKGGHDNSKFILAGVAMPIACNSLTTSRPTSSWPGELG